MADLTRSQELATKYGRSYVFANRIISGSQQVLTFGVIAALMQTGIGLAVMMGAHVGINFFALLALLTSSVMTILAFYAASLGLRALGANLQVNVDNAVNTSPYLEDADRSKLLFSVTSYSEFAA